MNWGRPTPPPTPPQSPPVGITIVRPTGPIGHDRYGVGHFFRGVCICACPLCTRPGPKGPGPDVVCTCPDCHVPACGARPKPTGGAR